MTTTESKGKSMLDQLAGKIVTTKTVAGSKLSPALTPVAGERGAVPVAAPTAFPYDAPSQALTQTIASLERERAALDGIINALKLLNGQPDAIAEEIAKDAALSAALLAKEEARRKEDRIKAQTDARAAARVAAESPMAEVVEAVEAKDRKRAAVLAVMAGEQPGGETFEARMARLSAEAQTSAFGPTNPDGSIPVPVATGTGGRVVYEPRAFGWSCPKHGDSNIIVKRSPRRGMEFRKCAADDCHEFEKV